MKNKQLHLLFRIVLIAQLSVIILVVTDCNTTEKEYRKFVVNEGVAHFSFEYPITFEKPYIFLEDWTHFSTLLISRHMPEKDEGVAEFAIAVIKPTSEFPNTKAKLDYSIFYKKDSAKEE